MSRIPKWKVEKAKVKVVFRLQFHATHIPQPGWDKLFVSFVPSDTGKVTAKTNKASVRNGICKWSDPIYETTRLLLDTRTKQYEEKLYKLVVSMGSSRSSLLGEVSINLAEFADALKPSSVALPLRGGDSATVLLVTVQLLTSKTGFREFEQQRELSVKGLQTMSSQRSHDHTELAAASLEATYGQIEKANSKARFKKDPVELTSLEETGESIEDFDEDSAAGVDRSSFTSDSFSTEKNEATANEIDRFKSTNSGDLNGFSIAQSSMCEKEDWQGRRLSTQGSHDWIHGWTSDYSVDHDLATAYEENSRLRMRLEVAESAFSQLKLEAKSLQRITDELGLETESLSQQLLLELASGEQLTREVSMLRAECSNLRTDLEEIKSAKMLQKSLDHSDFFPSKHDLLDGTCKLGVDAVPDNAFRALQEICLKGFLYIETKVRDIQSKTFLVYSGNEFENLHQDFEVLGCAIENLKADIVQGRWQEVNSSSYSDLTGPNKSCQDHDFLAKDLEASKFMEEKIYNLLQKLEESNTENEALMKKMNQMECYYEGLIVELEESQKHAIKESENLKNEHSSSLYTISVLQGQMDKVHQEMNRQLINFAEDRNILESEKKELERRAITSEASLKRVRANYAMAVDRLQKDLELLSFQVFSMYESNEILAKQDFSTSYQSWSKESPEKVLSWANKDGSITYLDQESEDSATTRFQSGSVNLGQFHMQNGVTEYACHASTTAMCEEKVPTLMDLQIKNEAHVLKEQISHTEADILEMHMLNVHLGIFSEVLQETLLDVNNGIMCMKCYMLELQLQIENATEIKESLVQKLHMALDDVRVLRQGNIKYVSKCEDLTLKNKILEEKLQNSLDENTFLTERMTEYKNMMAEYRSYEDMYYACLEEKNAYEKSLKEENQHNNCLHTQMNCMVEEVRVLKEELDKQTSERINAQASILEIQDKLRHLYANMVSCNEQVSCSATNDLSLLQDVESDSYTTAVIKNLEQFQQEVCKRINQLRKENQEKEEMRNSLKYSLNVAESEIVFMKQKFDSDLKEIIEKLDLSNRMIDTLQLDLHTVSQKFEISSEVEKKSASTNEELSSKLKILEIKLQRAVDQNKNLVQQVLELDTVKEELKRTKIHLSSCIQENKTLSLSMKSTSKTSTVLENELSTLKESLRCNDEVMRSEKSLRQGLETAVEDLTSQLKEKDQRLKEFTEKLDFSNRMVETLQVDLETVSQKFESSSAAGNKSASRNEELSSKLRFLETELQQAVDGNRNLVEQLLEIENVKEELERTKIHLSNCMQENKTLLMSMESTNESCSLIENELSSLKESLRCCDEVMKVEKSLKEGLETAVRNLTLQLKEKDQKLLSLLEKRTELDHLCKTILDLKMANAVLEHHSVQNEERCKMLDLENSSLCCEVMDMKSLLASIIKHLLTAEIETTYMRTEFPNKVEELLLHIKALKRQLDKTLLNHKDDVAILDNLAASEVRLTKENTIIAANLESLKSELETFINEKQSLLAYVNEREAAWSELHSIKVRAEDMENDIAHNRNKYDNEILQLKHLLSNFEEEVENLRSSRDELEMTDIILRSKITEHQLLLEEYENNVKMLKEENNGLSCKLSEQILRTEEFRSLSVHLKELKDKADAENHQTRDNKDTDGSSFAIQESLRIAFIKEQYESMIQELKSQLYASKNYAEEMLLKFQNAVDEVESGKKSEVSLAKKVEDLSMKILDIETELETALTDRKELVKAYDRMKAELECAILSLDCCNEEKLKLEACLKDSNEEKRKFRVEHDLVKRILSNMASADALALEDEEQAGVPAMTSIGQMLHSGESGYSPLCLSVPNIKANGHGEKGVPTSFVDSKDGDQLSNMNGIFKSSLVIENMAQADITNMSELPSLPDPTALKDLEGAVGEGLSENNSDHTKIEEHFREQRKLKTSMEHIYKELERLRNENLSSFPPEEHFDPFLYGLEKELAQLDMANEQLGSMFPSYREFSGSGNALERVLSLELELAEALQTKKKPGIHFQSSFLKQHTDEAAVFQSFRDINELIQEMLELKSRHATIATELNEMHTRYSQLSLQFAEVEGERQRLMMTIKNRSPKKS